MQRKLDEIKALHDELKQLRAQQALGQAAEIAAAAGDGVIVHRVDGLEPGDLRDLAIAVRQQPGVRRVVLDAAPRRPAVSARRRRAAVRSGSRPADLIKAAAKAVGGGGGGKGDIATAGGKDPSGLDEALRIAAEAASCVTTPASCA